MLYYPFSAKAPVLPTGWTYVQKDNSIIHRLVTASVFTSKLFVIGSDDQIYTMNGNSKFYTGISPNKRFQSVSYGPMGLWAVQLDGQVVFRDGLTETNPDGTRWVLYRGVAGVVEVISGFRNIFAITESGVMYYMKVNNQINPSWTRIDISPISITEGTSGIWFTDSKGDIFWMTNVLATEQPLGETRLKFKKIVHGFGALLYAIDQNNMLYQRGGKGRDGIQSSTWLPLKIYVKDVTVNKDGIYIILFEDNRIAFKEGELFGFAQQ